MRRLVGAILALTAVAGPASAQVVCPTDTPPKVAIIDPARDNLYVQDSMRTFTVNNAGAITITSITVKALATDDSAIDAVGFFVDNGAVPASEVFTDPNEPDVYQFRYDISGATLGAHEITFIARDDSVPPNESSDTRQILVVDASALTDQIATDVTDQYGVIIAPDKRNEAFFQNSGTNYYAIEAKPFDNQPAHYLIKYRVWDYESVVKGSVSNDARLVPRCSDNNRLFVVAASGGVNAAADALIQMDPGAFPGFWHETAYTVTSESVPCQGTNANGSFFSQGTYHARIPLTAVGSVVGQPVGLWAYVDVQNRASTTGPTGGVDSASGFFNILKPQLEKDPAADRLDETPTPVVLLL